MNRHKLSPLEMHRLTVADYKAAPKLPLVVVLDNIRSVYNVGSLFRTADAFRVSRLYLCGITACPPSAELHKTALGAEDSVDWTYCPNVLNAARELHDSGYCILALEQVEGSISPARLNLLPERGPYALVIGNEVHGVCAEVCDLADECIEIPQRGTKHSLNVANAAAIAMWECFKQLETGT